MLLTVTAKHLADGIPGNPCGCAFALALKDAGAPAPSVGLWYYEWDVDLGVGAPIPLSREAMIFVRDYDNGKPVIPAQFVLPDPM